MIVQPDKYLAGKHSQLNVRCARSPPKMSLRKAGTLGTWTDDYGCMFPLERTTGTIEGIVMRNLVHRYSRRRGYRGTDDASVQKRWILGIIQRVVLQPSVSHGSEQFMVCGL